MKTCQTCGFEDVEEKSFCGRCGSAFKAAPKMVVPLAEINDVKTTERVTESFPPETETVVENRFQLSIPTISAQQQKSKKPLIWIAAGLIGFVFVAIAGGLVLLGFLWFKQISSVKTAPTPIRKIETPKPTFTPLSSPSAAPTKTPQEKAENEFPPPTKPTRKASFNIEADTDGWQLSEIETVGSETFQTSVRGTIVLGEIGSNISPGGVGTNKDRRIYKQYPTGALLMRTRFSNGKTSDIQPVTASDVWENDPNESGRIEFLVNDNSPENNEGEFVVSVEMVSVPK